MNIPESDHAELNKALLELRNLYRPNPNYRPEIIAKARGLLDECCRLPEWDASAHYMDAGLAAVAVHLKKNYPWLTEKAFHAVHFECMIAMK